MPPAIQGCPSPAAAEEVDVRARFGERIARRLDALNPREGIEDDPPPLRRVVVYAGSERDCAERDLLASVRPRDSGIGRVIARFGHLHEHTEPDRTISQSFSDLVEQEILGPRGCLFVGQVLVPPSGRMRNRP